MARPAVLAPALSVFEFDMVGYKRTWRGSVLSSFVLPVLFVVGFGLGVGKYVNAGGQLGKIPYLDFIVPGMLASTAMQVAFGESAYPIMSRFQWVRTYHAMVAAPLRIGDIIVGDLMFMTFRLVTTSTVFLAVTALFGAVHSWWALTVPLTCALLGLAIATPIFAYTGQMKSDSSFALLQRFLVVPMSLFAGVFFPISQLPAVLRFLAYLSPLWHAVQLCRAATLPQFGLTAAAALGHVAYLAAWAVAGFLLARITFRNRLVV